MPAQMPPGLKRENPVSKIQEQVLNAKSILIVTHENPTLDSLGASLSLYLGLTSLGKQVTIACPDEIRVEMSNFVGVNKVVNTLTKRMFVVSLDYVEGSIEKVSYNIAQDKFNLVIETREGFDPFSPEKVSYSTSGAVADLIFTIDTIHLGGLKAMYESEKELFAGKTLVNVDRHANNTQYGSINVVNPMASSTSELVAEIMSGIGIKLSVDIATNLLNGIYGATENFSLPVISPRSFEVAAVCVRAGGKRFTSGAISTKMPDPIGQSDNQNSMRIPQTEQKFVETTVPQNNQFSPMPSPVQQPTVQPQVMPIKTQYQQEMPRMNPVVSNVSSQIGDIQKSENAQTPDDWLKPKIYKSKDLPQ